MGLVIQDIARPHQHQVVLRQPPGQGDAARQPDRRHHRGRQQARQLGERYRRTFTRVEFGLLDRHGVFGAGSRPPRRVHQIVDDVSRQPAVQRQLQHRTFVIPKSDGGGARSGHGKHGRPASDQLHPAQRLRGYRLHRQCKGDTTFHVLDSDRIAPAQFTDRAIDGAQCCLVQGLGEVVLQLCEAGGGHLFFSCYIWKGAVRLQVDIS